MKKILLLLLLVCFFTSCKDPDIFFFLDDKYFEMLDDQVSLLSSFKKSIAASNLKLKSKVIITEREEIDLGSEIGVLKAPVIVLSPLLAKKTDAYHLLLPNKLFIKLSANGVSESENIGVIYKNREMWFRNLADEVFSMQQEGASIGLVFWCEEERRKKERSIFVNELKNLNSGNYELIESVIPKTSLTGLPREVSAKMTRAQVDILLLFGASLNKNIIEAFPINSEIQFITEDLYPSDNIFQNKVLFSCIYDYDSAFLKLGEVAAKFIAKGGVEKSDLNIPLNAKTVKISTEIEKEISTDEEEKRNLEKQKKGKVQNRADDQNLDEKSGENSLSSKDKTKKKSFLHGISNKLRLKKIHKVKKNSAENLN